MGTLRTIRDSTLLPLVVLLATGFLESGNHNR